MSQKALILREKKMNIIDFIPYGHNRAITYYQLQNLTGFTRREIRREISKARKEYIILNLQDKKGFFRPLDDEVELIKRFYKQENHRNNEHRATLIPIEEFMAVKGIDY